MSFSEHKDSYYQEPGTDKDRIDTVNSDTAELQKRIENFLGLRRMQLNTLVTDIDKNFMKEQIPEIFPEKLEFNKLVLSRMNSFLKSI